ncbi:hypothetical protein OAY13_00620 [Candidatus Pelagibacter sp.]|nr:hypothetical protein [Candidatus Pelagibacter sp.]
MNFYSFLYLTKKNNPNLKKQILKSNIEIYYKNALNLFYSIEKKKNIKNNYKFTLITNNKSYLIKNFGKPKNFFIKQLKFKTLVPKNINFYSSHFKLDVFRYLSNLNHYSILLDLDVVLINHLKLKKFLKLKKKNIICLYDRTIDTKRSYKYSKIKSDIEFLGNKKLNKIRWFGGEFISGPSHFFGELYKSCKSYEEKYYKNHKKFFHNGDEMLTNVFFNFKENMKYCDMGKEKIIYRYWNNITLHKQKKFKLIKKFAFLHLPADKLMLAKIPLKNMHNEEFIKYYENLSQKYLRRSYLYFKNKLRRLIEF